MHEQIDGPPDRVVADLADRQHGVVARRQLLDAGLTPSMLEVRLERGRLLVLHRGVYAVGHRRLRREGHWLAAVLASGPGAALSHRAAAALHELRPAGGAVVDVTAPQLRRVAGVRIHRAALTQADVTAVDGIPATTVARTLVDLAGMAPRRVLAKAIEEAQRSHRFDLAAIEAALARTRGRKGPGHAAMRQALAEIGSASAHLTRSALEDAFLDLVTRGGLPRPATNIWLGSMEVDACWPTQRLVVELDGYAFHGTAAAFQRDRERTNDLTLAGWLVLRFTYEDVIRRPGGVTAKIAEALRRRRG